MKKPWPNGHAPWWRRLLCVLIEEHYYTLDVSGFYVRCRGCGDRRKA